MVDIILFAFFLHASLLPVHDLRQDLGSILLNSRLQFLLRHGLHGMTELLLSGFFFQIRIHDPVHITFIPKSSV